VSEDLQAYVDVSHQDGGDFFAEETPLRAHPDSRTHKISKSRNFISRSLAMCCPTSKRKNQPYGIIVSGRTKAIKPTWKRSTKDIGHIVRNLRD